jgi:integral membrane sensor domain MASE1
VRSLWYFFHWLSGIAICTTGITNVYIGLRTYHERTTKSVRLWTSLLTLEVCFLVFFYLMIDRWSYMMKQGQLPVEQLRTIDNRRTYLTTLRKELSMVQE